MSKPSAPSSSREAHHAGETGVEVDAVSQYRVELEAALLSLPLVEECAVLLRQTKPPPQNRTTHRRTA